MDPCWQEANRRLSWPLRKSKFRFDGATRCLFNWKPSIIRPMPTFAVAMCVRDESPVPQRAWDERKTSWWSIRFSSSVRYFLLCVVFVSTRIIQLERPGTIRNENQREMKFLFIQQENSQGSSSRLNNDWRTAFTILVVTCKKY